MAYENARLNAETGEVFTPKGRFVWPSFLEARTNKKFPDKPPTFSGVILLPKAANIDAIKVEIGRAAQEKHGADWRKKVKADKFPLKKTSDNPKLEEYAVDFPFYLTASANADFKPVVFGPDTKPFDGKSSEIYGGRWGVIAGKAWGYDKGSNGVGWNLDRVQLLDHDEPIGGGRNTSSDGFEKVESAGTAPAGAAGGKTTDSAFDDEIPF